MIEPSRKVPAQVIRADFYDRFQQSLINLTIN